MINEIKYINRREKMADKKNIVLILVDQLRPDFIGPYGADFIRTPNLDELAENGVTYDNAIAGSTVCAPSRASVLTLNCQFFSSVPGVFILASAPKPQMS